MKHNVFKFSDTCYRQKDGIAIGSVNNNKTFVNTMCKLEWIASLISDKIIALDIEKWVDRTTKCIKHKSHAKEQNLFLYLSPNSEHSPNNLEGIVCSMIEKHWWHWSDVKDYQQEIHLFFQRLMDVGHNPTTLSIIFGKASHKLQMKINKIVRIKTSA